MISASWTDRWEQVVPFLAFPPDVRRAVYTTNTIEALNRQIRIKTRGSFPSDPGVQCRCPRGRRLALESIAEPRPDPSQI